MKFNGKWFKQKWVSYTIATCSAVILYMLLSNISTFIEAIDSFFAFLSPVITGIVIAYIFNPVANFFETTIFKNLKNEKTKWKVSVAVTILVILLAIVLLFVALIPQLVDSVSTFITNLGGYVDSSMALLKEFETGSQSSFFGINLSGIANIGENVLNKIGAYFSENMNSVVSSSLNFGKGFFNILIAFILAIYLLLDKKRIQIGFAGLINLVMKPESYKKTADFFSRCNNILIRYISFDAIEGVIVGVINFFYMLIAGMPYSVLISVIVGLTNLAPTFGPIIGCVIGAFILVLVKPIYALSFIIFTIILQTVDGYIFKPRLFGESLGVSPLMILISIVLGGRLFGVIGILLAIPVAAIVDFVWKDYVLKKLEDKKEI